MTSRPPTTHGGRGSAGSGDTPFSGLLATGLALGIVVVAIRGRIAGALFSSSLKTPVDSVLKALGAAFYDLLFIAVCTVAALAFARFARGERPRRYLSHMFLAVCLVLLAVYLAHISVMKYLSQPFTYQWLYYSDFLGSLNARQAVVANLNTAMLVVSLVALGLFLVLRAILRRLLDTLVRTAGMRIAAGASLAAVAGLLALSHTELGRWNIPYAKTAQPVVAFVASLRNTASPIYAHPTSGDVSDFVPRPAVPLPAGGASGLTGQPPLAGTVRNVVFYVMESVGAEFVGLYGSRYGATPRLDAQRSRSLIVRNAYAHSPTSNMTLVSLLTGTYPWTTERLVTSDYPDIRLPTISTMLKDRGYETAFFSAADFRFQNADVFLAHRDFDRVSDYRSMRCEEAPSVGDSKESFSTPALEHLGGIDDGCATDALNGWIESVGSKSFFAVYWSHMTHYPYRQGHAIKAFDTQDADLGRYLNALSEGDRALGSLLDTLERRGLADSTLVVVLGDHGEAFGRHGDRVHGGAIFEDNIRIPLVFINPRLFSGETREVVGGVADIPPTVMPLLGGASDQAWQGRNLLTKDGPGRTYFFTPWSGLLLGYREGRMKYIYDALSGTLQAYDVEADRFETTDLAAAHAADRDEIVSRIAGWVQYQDAFVRAAASGKRHPGGSLAERRE